MEVIVWSIVATHIRVFHKVLQNKHIKRTNCDTCPIWSECNPFQFRNKNKFAFVSFSLLHIFLFWESYRISYGVSINYLLEAVRVYAYTERAREKKKVCLRDLQNTISIIHYNLNIYLHPPKGDLESQYSIINHSILIEFRQAAIVLSLSGLCI